MQYQIHSKALMLLFSIVVALNANDLKAQDYFNEEKISVNLNLGEVYKVDFFPGIDRNEAGFVNNYLPGEVDNYRKMFRSSGDISKESSLTKLSRLNVANGNLLQVHFNQSFNRLSK